MRECHMQLLSENQTCSPPKALNSTECASVDVCRCIELAQPACMSRRGGPVRAISCLCGHSRGPAGATKRAACAYQCKLEEQGGEMIPRNT